MARYSSLISSFAEHYGIALSEGFDIDIPGEILDLEVDGLVAYFEAVPAQNGLLLYSIIGTLPAEGGDGTGKELLAANCFFQSTGGMTLGAVANNVIIQKLIENPAMSPEDFGIVFQRFVEMAQFWQNRLELLKKGDNGQSAGADAAMPRRGVIVG